MSNEYDFLSQPIQGTINTSAPSSLGFQDFGLIGSPKKPSASMPSYNVNPGVKNPLTDKLSSGLQTAGTAIDALGGLARIFLGFKQSKLAAKDLKFQQDAFRQNMALSRNQFNEALENRARTRGATEGDPAGAAAYQARYTIPTPR